MFLDWENKQLLNLNVKCYTDNKRKSSLIYCYEYLIMVKKKMSILILATKHLGSKLYFYWSNRV